MKLAKGSAFRMTACAALASAMLMASGSSAAGQDENNQRQLTFDVNPLPEQDASMDAIQKAGGAKAGLKVWTYSIKSTRSGSAGDTYTGVMVGNSPYTTNGTTTTTVYVVPLIVEIGSHTFDPTVADKACYGGVVPVDALKLSPMVLAWNDFKINGVDMGATQYSDAFQRANFWNEVSAHGGTYHNKLNYKFLPAMT